MQNIPKVLLINPKRPHFHLLSYEFWPWNGLCWRFWWYFDANNSSLTLTMAAWQSSLKVANLSLCLTKTKFAASACLISFLYLLCKRMMDWTEDEINFHLKYASSRCLISYVLLGRRKCFVEVFFPSLLVIRNLLQFFWRCCRGTWYMAHIY